MNYPVLKKALNLPLAVEWLVEDSKDDFYPDPLCFRDIQLAKDEYLAQREHRFLQVDTVPSILDYVPKKNCMLREAIWLHPNHRLLYLATLQHLLPKLDKFLHSKVYSYRRDSDDEKAYPFDNRMDRWKSFHNDFRAACLDPSTNVILLTDIASFYDHINIAALRARIESMLGNSATDADRAVIELLETLLNLWSTTGFGIPQNLDASRFFGSLYQIGRAHV